MMTDEIREQVSALVDDELDDLERPLLLGRLQRDAGLRACLGRYQLIGEVMRGGHAQVAGLGIAARVQAELDGEPVSTPPPQVAARLWKPLAGLAIAASVALVAVLSVQRVHAPQQATPALASSQAPDGAFVRVDDGRWNRIEPAVEQRMNRYLVNHNEYAASRSMPGVMPYVRIVGYEGQQ